MLAKSRKDSRVELSTSPKQNREKVSSTVSLTVPTDPPVVRQFKWLMDRLALIFFVSPLKRVERTFPQMRGIIRATPNLMSVVRGIVAPFIVLELYHAIKDPNQDWLWAWLTLLAVNLLLDGIDGPLARRLDAVTDFGKLIDPLADKLTMVCMGLAVLQLVYNNQGSTVLLPTFLAVLVIESLLIVTACCFALLKRAHPDISVDGANQWGKLKFVTQIIAFTIGFAGQIGSPTNWTWVVVTITLLWVAIYFGSRSLVTHCFDYRRVRASLFPNQEVSP